jgi:hypothetical protein
MIGELEEPTMRDVLFKIASKYPSIMLDLMELTAAGAGDGAPGDPDTPEPAAAPSWCVCRRCRQMPTDIEKLCCGMNPDNCTSRLPVSK